MGSTSATTSGSMIAWSMTTPRVFGFISVLTLPTRRSCFASSRTTMSLGPQRLFHRQRSRPPQSQYPPSRGQDSSMKDNLKAER